MTKLSDKKGLPEFAPDKTYTVVLAVPVKHAGQTLRPGIPMKMRGDVAVMYRQFIETAKG